MPSAAPALSRSSAPPPMPTIGGEGHAHTHCGYCNRHGQLV